IARSGTKGCAERCDSSVPNHRDAITTIQNTGRASSFASAPDVPSASEAPNVTKLPVTCAVNRPCSARKPAVSTKPALKLKTKGSRRDGAEGISGCPMDRVSRPAKSIDQPRPRLRPDGYVQMATFRWLRSPATAGLVDYPLMKARRSALMVGASVVGMPCGKPLYVFSVPFFRSFADSGPDAT